MEINSEDSHKKNDPEERELKMKVKDFEILKKVAMYKLSHQ